MNLNVEVEARVVEEKIKKKELLGGEGKGEEKCLCGS